MRRLAMLVFCCILVFALTMSGALADDSELFWCKVDGNGLVTYRNGFGQFAQSWTFNLLSEGENWYLKYKDGDAVLLNDFDLQYLSNRQYSDGNWYVSSNAIQRALDNYNRNNNVFINDSEFILIEDTGTIFKLESDSLKYILKAEYQPQKLAGNDSDFGIGVIYEGEDIPKFWINLSKDEFCVENSTSGIKIFVSQLSIERALKSYQELLKFH